MANYKTAISKVLMHEGGYVNDPDDSGGETYKGISRRFHPSWGGWVLIDELRKKTDFPKGITVNPMLNGLVQTFYKVEFWDKLGCEGINEQAIADLLIDSAVNEGISPAIKRAQSIAGLPQTGKVNADLITKINLMR